ncbi:hypothetical protein J3R83DRAFT_4912 [Lanmaoa asiatica]|nr:hypothetical protein J3R83DRAFT_4912 [Lanmaoa asiatica]
MLPAPALLPKSGTIDASKVLYKILGWPRRTSRGELERLSPSDAEREEHKILHKYPGFPQAAEYLFYPMDVCRK